MKPSKAGLRFSPVLTWALICSIFSVPAFSQRSHQGEGSLFYGTSYVNTVLGGRTAGGGVFTFVGGKHELYWPYYDPPSKWDNMLLRIGEQGFFLTQPEIKDLSIEINSSGERILISFSGELNNTNGSISNVRLTLTMDAVQFPPRDKRVDFFGTSIGTIWQPYEVKSASAGNILAVDGQELGVERVYGGLETAELSWPRDPRFALKYDYIAVAYPDSESLDTNSYAYVKFSPGLLRVDDFLSQLLSSLIRLFGSEDVTIKASRTRTGNIERVDVSRDGPELIFEDIVELGLAQLQRQIIRTQDSSRRAVFGLREIFTPNF